jgi:hypothetical protein
MHCPSCYDHPSAITRARLFRENRARSSTSVGGDGSLAATGTTVNPDGSVGTCPPGSTPVFVETGLAPLCTPPQGIKQANGDTVMPDGSVLFADGSHRAADGTLTTKNGSTISPQGVVIYLAPSDYGTPIDPSISHALAKTAAGSQTLTQIEWIIGGAVALILLITIGKVV